ncbi:hypothetical protein N7532_001628 [Penicillium argentinense]|uniref:C2H2-type domain-containing protein n=1 Tax=Penicillium argentinense TaxID=1131581 RepID=A0A9W9G326_9EURO|nr:uncharacterized protein N7532_001628 [Penicillium argentinense]KAJ5111093.1 hypothetical protein N7532_001628 [Penicillium argentinense]
MHYHPNHYCNPNDTSYASRAADGEDEDPEQHRPDPLTESVATMTQSIYGSVGSYHEALQNTAVRSNRTTTSETSFDRADLNNSSGSMDDPVNVPRPPPADPVDFVGVGSGMTEITPTINFQGDDVLTGINHEPFSAGDSLETGLMAAASDVGRMALAGLTTNDTHRPRSGQELLDESQKQINNAFTLYRNGQLDTRNKTAAQQSLTYFLGLLNSTQQVPLPPPSSSASGPPPATTREHFKCLTCGSESRNRGSFKRHVNDQHHPEFEYLCTKPGCRTKQHRKDKIRTHVRTHGEWNNWHKRQLLCPLTCSLCPITTPTWDHFYRCFISHCVVNGSEGTNSRRSSADAGQGGPNGNVTGPLAPGANEQPRRSRGHLDVPEGPRRRQTPSRRGFGMSREGSNSSNPRCVPRPAASRTETPGNRRHLHHHHPPGGVASRHARPEPRSRNSHGPGCFNCHHTFYNCPIAFCNNQGQSTDVCHMCFSPGANATAVASNHPRQSQGFEELISPLDTSHGIDPAVLFEQTAASSFPTGQTMQYYAQMGQFHPGQQNHRSFHGMPGNQMNFPGNYQGHGPNNPSTWVVRDTTQPGLSEEELCAPPLGGKPTSTIGALMRTMTWKMSPLGWINKPSKSVPFTGTYGGKLNTVYYTVVFGVLIESGIAVTPLKSQCLPQSFRCNCACNTQTSKLAADFSRGRRVEMSFALSPSGPGPTLRNRVQIVVKLLSLRGATRKKTEARLAIEKGGKPIRGRSQAVKCEDEDDESLDDGSIFSDSTSATDMSLFDDQEPVPARQPFETEFTLDVDIPSSLRRISLWTGGLMSDFGEWDSCEAEFFDSEKLFEYFFRYILCFIMVFGRSADLRLCSRLND